EGRGHGRRHPGRRTRRSQWPPRPRAGADRHRWPDVRPPHRGRRGAPPHRGRHRRRIRAIGRGSVTLPPPRSDRPRRVGGDEGRPEVFVADEQKDVPVDIARWSALAEAVLHDEGVRGAAELSVLFVDETSIAELNERFMEHTGPTDVLAFPIDADAVWAVHDPLAAGPDRAEPDLDEIPLLLGDVVVCPAVAARNAPDHAGTVDDEL